MNNLINKLTGTNNSISLLPLRLATGTILAAHGAQKLFGWFGGYGLSGTGGFFEAELGLAPGVFWAFNAGAAEFFGGLMILAGVLTRVGAGLNVVTMAVAVLLVHRHAFFADQGGMEFPLLLLAASTTLLIAGGGRFSVDRTLAKQEGIGAVRTGHQQGSIFPKVFARRHSRSSRSGLRKKAIAVRELSQSSIPDPVTASSQRIVSS